MTNSDRLRRMAESAQRREELAKKAEAMGIPNLAKALRSKKSLQACEDIRDFWGWIRATVSMPRDGEIVIITDGKNQYFAFAFTIDESPNFYSLDYARKYENIIAWQYKYEIPEELIEACKI